jgi:recombination protein RecA
MTAVSKLDIAKKFIKKKYGNVVTPMSDRPLVIDTISTRSIGLDIALGRGGYAMGRLHEIYGGTGSGKTTLSMSVIAEAQRRGMHAVFIDAEHTADPVLFEAMGVDTSKLDLVSMYTGEDNLKIAETLMKTGEVDVVVIDSVSALIPKIAATKEIDEDTIALLARLMSKTVMRFAPIASEYNVLVIFINQIRFKIGGYGNPETTQGGNSLPFYCTSRVKVSGIQAKANRLSNEKGDVIGHITTFETVKNKLNMPFRKSKTRLFYGKGYDLTGEVVQIAVDLGIITKSGTWYKYNGESIGQGENGVIKFFDDNNDVYNDIKDQVVELVGLSEFYKAQHDKDKNDRKRVNE